MKRQILLIGLTISIFSITSCLKTVEISNYKYQKKIEELTQYRITNQDKVKSFIGLDINKDNFAEISKRITPNKLKTSKDICNDLQLSIPQVWDKISALYKLPNTWDKDSLTICKMNKGRVEKLQIKMLSYWSKPITYSDEQNSVYLKSVRNINTNNGKEKIYKFRVSSVITANLNYDDNGEIKSIFFAIDCDYYLKYGLAGIKYEKETDWKVLLNDNLSISMIQQVNKDMQGIILKQYQN